jgi:hypothetical protein
MTCVARRCFILTFINFRYQTPARTLLIERICTPRRLPLANAQAFLLASAAIAQAGGNSVDCEMNSGEHSLVSISSAVAL